jgi:O-acetyl-ADP-ribose deacetylase (regulator of RNase III)
MPNAAQIATYNFIRSEIARLRGPDSHVPVSLDQITALADEGDKAVFRVNGARVYIKSSGKVVDTGLPDCPTYASGLLPGRFLPAIAADLLSQGNPHKRFVHSHSHTPDSFVAYLQHGTVLDKFARDGTQQTTREDVLPLRFGSRSVEFISASITRLPEKYSALVSSDDNYLTHAGGVSRELWSAAGSTLNEEVNRERPTLRLGDVHPTKAGKLSADWLLHAVTIDLDSNRRISTENPTALIRSVLIKAESLGCTSIAIPLLGTGAALLLKDAAVEAFASALKVWAAGPSALARIALVTLPAESALLLEARKLLSGIRAAEDVVKSLKSPFSTLGDQWLSLSATPVDLRFYRATSLLELVLNMVARGLGLATSKESRPVLQLIETMTKEFGDQVAVQVREAWMLRNQLAHRRGPNQQGEGEALGAVNLALFAMFSQLAEGKLDHAASLTAELDLNSLSESPRRLLRRRPEPLAQIRLPQNPTSNVHAYREEAQDEAGATGDISVSQRATLVTASTPVEAERVVGVEPIRQLRVFVDKSLAGRRREHFFETLNTDEYAGPDELRLLEFLIRVEDPAEWLSNEFAYYTLQQELRVRGRTPNTDDRH